jgi:hypothetical protein
MPDLRVGGSIPHGAPLFSLSKNDRWQVGGKSARAVTASALNPGHQAASFGRRCHSLTRLPTRPDRAAARLAFRVRAGGGDGPFGSRLNERLSARAKFSEKSVILSAAARVRPSLSAATSRPGQPACGASPRTERLSRGGDRRPGGPSPPSQRHRRSAAWAVAYA